jgi:hypothetical protein
MVKGIILQHYITTNTNQSLHIQVRSSKNLWEPNFGKKVGIEKMGESLQKMLLEKTMVAIHTSFVQDYYIDQIDKLKLHARLINTPCVRSKPK